MAIARWSLAGGELAGIGFVLLNKLTAFGAGGSVPGRDSGVFATIGRGILAGGVPYRDFWDHKLPGVYYLDALAIALFGPGRSGLFAVEIASALASLVAFGWLGRALGARAWTGAGVAVFGLFVTLPNLTPGGNLAEDYWPLPIVLLYGALLRALAPDARRRTGLFALAGGAAGAAVLLKQQAGLHALGIGLALLLTPGGWRWRDALVAGLAGFAVLGLGLGPVVAAGALGDAWDQVVVYNRAYIGAVTWPAAVANLQSALEQAPHIPLLLVLAGGLAALGARSAAGSARRIGILLGAWLVLDLLALAIGGRFYLHSLVYAGPPATALLLWGIVQLATDRPRTRRRAVGVAFGGLGLAVIGLTAWASVGGAVATATRLGLWPGTPPAALVGPPDPRPLVAAALRARTQPGDAVFVWGAEAGLYVAADRRPASRFLYDYPLIDRFGDLDGTGYASPARRAELLADLAADPPQVIVVAADHADWLARVPALAELIATSYHRDAVVAGFALYVPAGCAVTPRGRR